MDRFRYLPMTEQLVVGDYQLATEDGEAWQGPLEAVAHASLSSLRGAMRARAANHGWDESFRDQWGMPACVGTLSVSAGPAAEFDEEYSVYEPVVIEVLADGQVVLAVMVGTVLDDQDLADLPSLLAPLLRRPAVGLVGTETEGTGSRAFTWIRVKYSRRGATVQDAIDFGISITGFMFDPSLDQLSAGPALELVISGRADRLVGLEESSWLEAKSQGYDLTSDHGKIELAQDVARFANGDEPGIVVVGLRTRKTQGFDRIVRVCPATDSFDVGRYHRTIDARLFPPVQGLVVRSAPARLSDGRVGYVLAIYVPMQPDESKPFLVHGAIVKGKIEGAFISIVRRRGEHSIPVTAAAIHATLAAGRALQKGKGPPIE